MRLGVVSSQTQVLYDLQITAFVFIDFLSNWIMCKRFLHPGRKNCWPVDRIRENQSGLMKTSLVQVHTLSTQVKVNKQVHT